MNVLVTGDAGDVEVDSESDAARAKGRVRRRPDRRLLLLLTAWSVLLVGIGASVAGGLWWDHYQQAAATDSASDTASAISAAVGDSLRSDLNFEAAAGAYVTTSPDLTNRQFAGWLASTGVRQRYPGTAGFTSVERVSAAELPAFVAAVEADPPEGLSATPYTLYPPGNRPEYCLMRFGAEYRAAGLPVGIDLCSLAPGRFARVSQTGDTDFATFRSILSSGSIPSRFVGSAVKRLGDLFVLVSPASPDAAATASSGVPAGATAAWMVATFSIRSLLVSGLEGTTDVKVSLRYRQGSGPWLAIGSAGVAPGSHLSAVRTVQTGGGLDARIEAVVTSSVSTTPFHSGLLAGIAGSVLSLLVFGFLVFLASSRRRAFALVEERTRELRHQALHDALTDLPNRALLFDRAHQMLLRARRVPKAIGALYIDLDHFKEINDTFGHQAGDQLLRAVATRIRTALRASDTVGRLGGDEFLVLVEGDPLDAGPELVAERLLAVLSEPILLDTPERVAISVRASIGAAIGMRPNADELIRDADIALYAAKASGRNRVVVFKPEMQTAVQDRLTLELDLQQALDDGQLFVLYQPILDLRTMSVKGAEALVRWRHPSRGVLPPEAFIPLAEETGLVVPIGRFVLGEACRQLAAWRAAGYDVSVAVNVSPLQLGTGRLVDDVRQALREHHLSPGWLTLEMTETTLMADTEATIDCLARLKKLGVRISMDDFGTGYSSLSYLRQFPIDVLKIDQSFITKLDDNAASGSLVHSIVELGKALGIEILAEGIEDGAQLAWLQRERCDSGQGYLFAWPIDPVELESRFLHVPPVVPSQNGPQAVATKRI